MWEEVPRFQEAQYRFLLWTVAAATGIVATMGVWLGKNILGQVDEIRHELFGNISTQLQIVIPRGLEAATAPDAQLIDAGEESDVEIESADYETVADNE
jgi:hypothetical protein